MNRKARAALLKSISKDWISAKEAGTTAGKLQIKAVNLLRDIGLKAQQASGHEQLTFSFHHSVASELPGDLTFDALKRCVHIANKLEKPAETLDEARFVMQTMFEALGEATAPKRLEAQSSHDRNPWSDFVSGVSSLTSLFAKLEEEPMPEWDKVKLTKFVQTTDPIVDKNREARELLAK